MASMFGSIIVEKLKRFQGSIAVMTGLVSAGASSSQGSRENTAPEASGSTGPNPEKTREQHKQAMLDEYGIKVRDYAYESTLPPVRSYRPPRPKGPQPLKRKRKAHEMASSDDEDDYNPIVVLPSVLDEFRSRAREETKPSKRPRPLERTPTEPVVESQSQPPMGYSDVSQITEADAALNIPMRWMGRKRQASLPPTPSRLPTCSVNTIGSPTSHPVTSSEGTSQDPEPWIDTPPISPFTSPVELPANATFASTSHTDSPSLQRRSVTFSPTTHTPSPSQSHSTLKRTLSHTLSHLYTPPRLSRTPTHRQLQLSRSRSHMSIPRRMSTGSIASPSLSPPPPRYQLRDRKSLKSPARPTLLRHRRNSLTSPTSSPPHRAKGKPRSSTSKGATKNAGKMNVSPSKPALRRSARRAGIRL